MASATFVMTPIAVVAGGRTEPVEEGWSGVEAEIKLDETGFGAASPASRAE
ncbi:MAG TPA: hypothetical protein VNM91_04325 [Dehalococcoidia bacterium]|nr:hypothetical protein [Dehalococcoidia bacterium]